MVTLSGSISSAAPTSSEPIVIHSQSGDGDGAFFGRQRQHADRAAPAPRQKEAITAPEAIAPMAVLPSRLAEEQVDQRPRRRKGEQEPRELKHGNQSSDDAWRLN